MDPSRAAGYVRRPGRTSEPGVRLRGLTGLMQDPPYGLERQHCKIRRVPRYMMIRCFAIVAIAIAATRFSRPVIGPGRGHLHGTAGMGPDDPGRPAQRHRKGFRNGHTGRTQADHRRGVRRAGGPGHGRAAPSGHRQRRARVGHLRPDGHAGRERKALRLCRSDGGTG